MSKLPPAEAVIWIGALIVLALLPEGESHFTVCPLALLGFEWCPGCGLGRGVSAVFHGHLAESFHYHPLALPAIAILGLRSLNLIFKHYTTNGKNHRRTA